MISLLVSYSKIILPLFLVAILVFLNAKHIFRIKIKSTADKFILLLVSIALLVNLFLPIRHYLHNDEIFYISFADQLTKKFYPLTCFGALFNDRNVLECVNYQISGFEYRLGYPVILSIFFKFFGSSEIVAHIVSILASVVCIFLVYKITLNLYGKNQALIASILATFLPERIWLATTTTNETFCVLFLLLGIYFYSILINKPDFSKILSVVFCIAISVTIRIELFFIFVLVISFILYKYYFLLDLKNRSILLTIISLLSTMFAIILYEGWGNYLGSNILVNVEQAFGLHIFYNNIYSQFVYHIHSYHILIPLLIIFLVYKLALYSLHYASSLVVKKLNSKHVHNKYFLVYIIPTAIFFTVNSFYYSIYPAIFSTSIRFVLLWALIAIVPFSDHLYKISYYKNYSVFFILMLLYSIFVYNRYIPIASDLHYVYERNIIKNFQIQNNSCVYVSDVPYYDIFNGYSSISYNEFLGNEETINTNNYNTRCVVFPLSMRCGYPFSKECEKIKQKYPWKIERIGFVDFYYMGTNVDYSIKSSYEYSQLSLIDYLIYFLKTKYPLLPFFKSHP